MKKALFLIITLPLLLSSCFTPMNLNFESAKMLEKGGVEATGSASSYYFPQGGINTSINAGVKVGYGIHRMYNLKFRYEFMYLPFGNFDLDSDETESFSFNYHYLQIDNKVRIGEHSAFSVPFGVYLGPEQTTIYTIDPRAYVTFGSGPKFEFTLVPKIHIIFLGNERMFNPGVSAGFGFSSDLSKWAIRPELGYDNFFSFGVGFSYFFRNTRQSESKLK